MTEYEDFETSVKHLVDLYKSQKQDNGSKSECELLGYIAAALTLQANLQILSGRTNVKLLQEIKLLRETLEINNECISELKHFM